MIKYMYSIFFILNFAVLTQEWNFDIVSNKWNVCQCSPDRKQNGVYVFDFRIIYNWAYHQQYWHDQYNYRNDYRNL